MLALLENGIELSYLLVLRIISKGKCMSLASIFIPGNQYYHQLKDYFSLQLSDGEGVCSSPGFFISDYTLR